MTLLLLPPIAAVLCSLLLLRRSVGFFLSQVLGDVVECTCSVPRVVAGETRRTHLVADVKSVEGFEMAGWHRCGRPTSSFCGTCLTRHAVFQAGACPHLSVTASLSAPTGRRGGCRRGFKLDAGTTGPCWTSYGPVVHQLRPKSLEHNPVKHVTCSRQCLASRNGRIFAAPTVYHAVEGTWTICYNYQQGACPA